METEEDNYRMKREIKTDDFDWKPESQDKK